MTKIQKNEVKYRDGNTVGQRLKKISKKETESRINNVYKALEKNEKGSRVLMDYFRVSITPKVTERGWDFIKNEDKELINKHGKYDFKPIGYIEELEHDEFFRYFIERFSVFFDFSKDYEETKGDGHGSGFNYGRIYTLGETTAKVFIRSFNPENSEREDSEYALGSRHNNYVNQKVQLDISGDGLQYLRSNGTLLPFLMQLYGSFPVVPTTVDIAVDFFNYEMDTIYFRDLYDKDFYIGRSFVYVMGHSKCPTLYIGESKTNESVMIYDKLLESKDTRKADEPELLKLLVTHDGNWHRLEKRFTREGRSAEQVMGAIMYDIFEGGHRVEDMNNQFTLMLSSMLHTRLTAPQKPRFLSAERKDRNNSRISTDKKWQEILDEIKKIDIDFSYNRPVLTLKERMDNFKYKSLGGKLLYRDIIDELGEEAFVNFMNEVSQYHIVKYEKDKEMMEDES